jgi:AAA+ ATPase superfamily predicted ATPase
MEDVQPPHCAGWEPLFTQIARLIDDRREIMIWDEYPYAVESDRSLPSHLQAAWDHLFKDKPILLVLAGSHIGMMVDQMQYNAPLYGRFTGQLPLDPLPFGAIQEFFPNYSAAERVAVYATLGGVPAYLEHFSPHQDFSSNVRQHLFPKVGLFRSEPAVLIGDLVRETGSYEAILREIAKGNHTVREISEGTKIGANNLSPYLKRLQELRLIERRVPATIPLEQRRSTTKVRYHLRDSYLRFYYRFIEPNLEIIETGAVKAIWDRIQDQFRSFIGATAYEELCREWILIQDRTRQMPFSPEIVGSYWSAETQIDVIAVNWREKGMLLGECKWGTDAVARSVVTELFEKTTLVVPGADWKVYYAFFGRAGFTPAAREAAQERGAILVDLQRLDTDLHAALAQAYPID